MRSQLVGPLLAYLRRRGVDVEGLARQFGLPADAEGAAELVLPVNRLRAFFDAAERAAGDPCLGLHAAAEFPRGAWGLAEFCSRSAPNVREGLRRIARYAQLCDDLTLISFEESPEGAAFEHRVRGQPLALGRLGNEFLLATILVQIRAQAGVAFAPERVWFAHPRPGDLDEVARAFGTRQLAFGAPTSGMFFGPALLDAPFVSSDPALLSLLDAYAEEAIAKRPPRAGKPFGDVRGGIGAALRAGRAPNVDGVARGLGLSARTLQRRLFEAGTSFQREVDAVREELARVYVLDEVSSLDDVASSLGYAEPSAFVRAFRRWTGVTPGQFRAQARAAPAHDAGAAAAPPDAGSADAPPPSRTADADGNADDAWRRAM
ncbi:MAG TPA: AraC family transcriptional regulator [Polyangiaceae bacterium]|nr:AraC family transcriptional regulator [Polyangiaceae bacterium]